ncbi:MAG: SBBP repeat-containing protein, partial [Bryobacterales bacterium]|nr:SBBP repeat-containing protein [Bryobacterales bacterium]
MRLLGANPDARVVAEAPEAGVSHYLMGRDSTKWIRNVPQYRRLIARKVYDGVDLAYYGNGRELEHDFILAPNADAGQIRLQFLGIENITTDTAGDLLLHTVGGVVRQRRPVAYQMAGGRRQEVTASYAIDAQRVVRFTLGSYNKNLPLVIDPVLLYGSYFGGNGQDEIRGIAVDSTGAIYVAGSTESTNLSTPSPLDSSYNGGRDVFIAKLAPSGGSLVYATYIGGSGADRANSLAIDATGAVYVAGSTASTDFPTFNAFDATYNGGATDAFVLKLSPAGNALAYSTFLGGTVDETANGIAVDPAGHAAITGTTNSSTSFPVKDAIRPASSTFWPDAFVTRLNPAGNTLSFSTFLGSSGIDEGAAVAVDAAGAVYVTGSAGFSDFQILNPFDGTWSNNEAFVTKFNPAGTLAYSSYLGGADTNAEAGRAITVDSTGAAYVAGVTDALDFPTVGGYANEFFGGVEAFLAKVAPSGATLQYSFRFGGSAEERVYGVALTPSGGIYVSGATNSSNFPFVNPHDTTNWGRDGFLSRFSAAGTVLEDSTLVGTGGAIFPYALATDSTGAVWVAGAIDGSVPVRNPLKGTADLNGDAFILSYGGTITTVPITLYSLPSGLTVIADGVSLVTPAILDWEPGSTHTLSTVSPQTSGGVVHNFNGWRDNPQQTRTIVAPASAKTYEAFFAPSSCAFQATPAAFEIGRGAQTITVQVNTQDGCTWAFYSDVPWINTMLSDSRTYVTFTVDGNTGPVRSGNLVVAGKTIPVVQRSSVAPSAPTALPAAVTGSPQTFTVFATDQDGFADINRVYFLVNSSPTVPANSCHGFYDRAANQFFLYNDTLTAVSGPMAPGSSGLLENTQCAVYGSLSILESGTGGTLRFKVGLGLKGAFAATEQKLYLWVVDNATNGTGWVQTATWGPSTASTNYPPAVLGGVSSNVTGSPQVVPLQVRDLNGASDIYRLYFLVNPDTNMAPGVCHGFYDPASNGIYLFNDGLTAALGPITPGSSGSLQNSQCTVFGSTSTVTPATGTDLTLNLGISLRGAFASRNQRVYLWARDKAANDTGWQQVGAWSAPAAQQPPSVGSVTPLNPSVATETLGILASDPNGYGDIYRIYFLVNTAASVPPGSCHGFYEPATNAVYLYNDALSAVFGPLALGSTGTIGNSQCAINGALSSVRYASGTNLMLDLNMTLKTPFANTPRNIFIWVRDTAANDTGWQQFGTWAPPAPATAPTAISGGPSSVVSTTTPETFFMSARDQNGQSDVTRFYFLVGNTAQVTPDSCHGFFDRASNA